MAQQMVLDFVSSDTPEIADRFVQDQPITVHTGEARAFLQTLPPGVAQLIVTSPPYNIGKAYEARRSIGQYLDEQASVIDELIRVLRDGGSICWQVGNHVDDGEVFPLDIFFY